MNIHIICYWNMNQYNVKYLKFYNLYRPTCGIRKAWLYSRDDPREAVGFRRLEIQYFQTCKFLNTQARSIHTQFKVVTVNACEIHAQILKLQNITIIQKLTNSVSYDPIFSVWACVIHALLNRVSQVA